MGAAVPLDRVGMARLFVRGLGLARVGAGLVQAGAPRLFLDRVMDSPAPSATPAPAWRMKGGRDLALGLLALTAGDDRALQRHAAAAVLIDGVDGLAVLADARAHLSSRVHPAGAVLGGVVAAAALWSAATLRHTTAA